MKIEFTRKGKLMRLTAYLMLFLLAWSCVFLDDIEYPETATAGETATFSMNVRIEPAEDASNARLVVGYLVPKSWDAANNTTVTYTSNVDEGVQTSSLIPEGNLPKNGNGLTWQEGIKEQFGFGPNVLNDMEWVVFWTDKVYNVSNGEKINAKFKLETKLGTENLRVKLGFFINDTGDGLSGDTKRAKALFSDCIEVTGGDGAVTDFCELHLNSAQPVTATKDDILTFKFQGDVSENALNGASEIFFCATAYTDNGNSYTVCDLGPSSKMRKESDFGNTYSITFWPGGYFNIPAGESITRIEYSFKNKDGSIEVIDNNASLFQYFFKCG